MKTQGNGAMERRVLVHIESMAHRGYGLTHVNGKVLFVPFSAVGDTGWVEVVESKKDYSIGQWSEPVKPSPSRTSPPCPDFGVCGGCQWQHIDYSLHGEMKRQILEEILRRLGGLSEIPPISVTPSPQPYGYRVRVQLKIKGGTLGYYRERSHDIVDIDRCPIAHPLINHLIVALREELPSLSQIREIEINVSPEEGKGICILHSLQGAHGALAKTLLQEQPILKGVAIRAKHRNIAFGDPTLRLVLSYRRSGEGRRLIFRVSPQSFFQVNPEQNRTMVETVLDFSSIKKNDRVLDLYAGIGNFTLPLASEAREVVGIEENRAAVKDARTNAERNGITNCVFYQGRAEELLKDWKRGNPSLVVLDPPRTGCKAIIDGLSALRPERIIYTSCEPTTFARDLRLFSQNGYHLQRLHLLDMFPQSYHMEVVGLLAP